MWIEKVVTAHSKAWAGEQDMRETQDQISSIQYQRQTRSSGCRDLIRPQILVNSDWLILDPSFETTFPSETRVLDKKEHGPHLVTRCPD